MKMRRLINNSEGKSKVKCPLFDSFLLSLFFIVLRSEVFVSEGIDCTSFTTLIIYSYLLFSCTLFIGRALFPPLLHHLLKDHQGDGNQTDKRPQDIFQSQHPTIDHDHDDDRTRHDEMRILQLHPSC